MRSRRRRYDYLTIAMLAAFIVLLAIVGIARGNKPEVGGVMFEC